LKKILFLFVLLFSFEVFSQHRHFIYYSEVNAIPDDSLTTLYYTFRIPYKELVFTKNDSSYHAAFRLNVEVIDSSKNHVIRKYIDKTVNLSNFNQTNDPDLYVHGLAKFKLPTGNFKVLPLFTDLNTNNEIKLHSTNYSVNDPDKQEKVIRPIIIYEGEKSCYDKANLMLANFKSAIPFSEEKFDMIFSVNDPSIDTIRALVIQQEDTLLNKNFRDYSNDHLSLIECENGIYIGQKNTGLKTKNFIINNFSNELKEGDFKVEVYTKNSRHPKIFIEQVQWINKPFSLLKPEYAIKMLKYMTNDDDIDNLLSAKSAQYMEELFEFWKKSDPTPKTQFNPLMQEYYQRVDYATKEFSSFTGKNGALTDRGMIFIQFGKPQKIERSSTEDGKVIETWTYLKSNKKFIFVDEEGKGEFSLYNG
jgi:GWxTD domain-containing protein